MAHQSDRVLGLDFGGTKLAAGVLDCKNSTMVCAACAETRAALGAETAVDDMLKLIAKLGHTGDWRGIGVSFGGHVYGNQILRSLHVEGWTDYPLERRLQHTLKVSSVRIFNDANAAAFGEWRFGAGRGANSLLYVTVSTGIGGGVILNGRLWDGAAGMAGEIGHMQVVDGGPMCSCGQQGCLEALAAGPAIARRAALSDVQLAARTGVQQALSARQVAQQAESGDPVAQQVLVECARYLGIGLANAANLLDVERVIVGGGVSRAGALWWRALRETFQSRILERPRPTALMPAELGEYAAVYGAAALAAG